MAAALANAVARLDPAPEDKQQARAALLGLLASETDVQAAVRLANELAWLEPSVADLSTWSRWAVRPTAALLGAARWNSAPADWLAALPRLP